MSENISINGVINSLVPITRFNKGEANKIFEEVKESGFKIVLKNNSPACVLISLEAYGQMLETIEDYRLLLEAEKRFENAKPEDFVSYEKALEELGIKKSDLGTADVEIE